MALIWPSKGTPVAVPLIELSLSSIIAVIISMVTDEKSYAASMTESWIEPQSVMLLSLAKPSMSKVSPIKFVFKTKKGDPVIDGAVSLSEQV